MVSRIKVEGGIIQLLGTSLEVYTGGTGIRLPLTKDQVRELRDALNAILGEPHVTGDEVHTVAQVARDLALEEAEGVADAAGEHAVSAAIRGLKSRA